MKATPAEKSKAGVESAELAGSNTKRVTAGISWRRWCAAWAYHVRVSLLLNFRSPAALVYGYAVPVLFLLGFAAAFRSGTPRLVGEMGPLLTISVLGGCCFGFPTALVAERERGVWRRYQLLPTSAGVLLSGTVAARCVLVGSAAVMQIGLARGVYGTPLPSHALRLVMDFGLVAFAFLGLGLVIAALADTVPAVQALGQCVFLPMILIGGVGVPLAVLPPWAREVAGFFPGRYAAAVLQAAWRGSGELAFDRAALGVIGAAAVVAGLRLFRWDADQRGGRRAWGWIAVALAAWLAVGVVAGASGRSMQVPLPRGPDPADGITDVQVQSIDVSNLPADDDVVTPLAADNAGLGGATRQRLDAFAAALATWPPVNSGSTSDRVRALVSVASLADVSQDPLEGRLARVVFDTLQQTVDGDELRRSLALLVLHPELGTVVTAAPELNLPGTASDDVIRDRNGLYARKLLGHLLGRL